MLKVFSVRPTHVLPIITRMSVGVVVGIPNQNGLSRTAGRIVYTQTVHRDR